MKLIHLATAAQRYSTPHARHVAHRALPQAPRLDVEAPVQTETADTQCYLLLTRPTLIFQSRAEQRAKIQRMLALVCAGASLGIAALLEFKDARSYIIQLIVFLFLISGWIGYAALRRAAKRTLERAQAQQDFTFVPVPQGSQEFCHALSSYLIHEWGIASAPINCPRVAFGPYDLLSTFTQQLPQDSPLRLGITDFTYHSPPLAREEKR